MSRLSRAERRQRKAANAVLNNAVEERFPHNAARGDSLAGVVPLGNSFRQVNRKDFRIIKPKPKH